MTPSNVSQVCCWLRVTEVDLFRAAYKWKYDSDGYIEPFIVDFSLEGKIPSFVKVFIWHAVYPRWVILGGLYENPLRPYNT